MPGKYTPRKRFVSKNMKARVAKLERQMRARTPEMKIHGIHGSVTLDPLSLTNPKQVFGANVAPIFQGEQVGQRQGNQIRLWKVHVRASPEPGMEAFLFRALDGTVLVESDFVSIENTMLKADQMGAQIELRHHYVQKTGGQDEYTGNTAFEWVYKPKGGILINFEGNTTLGSSEAVYFYFVNKTGAALSANYCLKAYYTDC